MNSWVRVSRRVANSPTRRGRLRGVRFEGTEAPASPSPPERAYTPSFEGRAIPDHTPSSPCFPEFGALQTVFPIREPWRNRSLFQGLTSGQVALRRKSSDLTVATRDPPCQMHVLPLPWVGQVRRERLTPTRRSGIQNLPLDLCAGRWAEISSSTLQQLQVISLSLQSALHISVALLVQYR